MIICKECGINEAIGSYRIKCEICRENHTKLKKFKQSVRNLINISFRKRGYKKNLKTEIILGCSLLEFKLYIESNFEPWMNWDNKSKFNGNIKTGWDLDHIKPISSAKTIDDVIELNHYTNYQPLCSYINRFVKKNKSVV